MIQELPKPAELIASAGDAFLRGDAADALRFYERATEVDPESADAHAGRSLALVYLERPGDAQRAALRDVAITPTHLVALTVLARATFDQKDFRRARQYCRCVLELDPTDEGALGIEAEIMRVLSPDGAFDAYISLGFNCEAGLQFMRVGYDESSSFRYAVAPFAAMFRLVENDFPGVFVKENLRPLVDDLVTDHATGLSFHSELPYEKDPVSGQKTFIPGNARDQIGALRDLLLRRYPRHDFTILVLQTADWPTNRLINRYLPRFAPLVYDADHAAWDRLFEEFLLRQRVTR